MEQNKVLIDLGRYDELLLAEAQLQLAKQILFNENNVLYQSKSVIFSIDGNQVKLAFPLYYDLQLNYLQEKECQNV